MTHNATGIENIINNKELGNLFNNVIKSINQNIEHSNENLVESDTEPDENEGVNEIVEKSNNDLTLLDTLSLIFVDKNGKNIADILTDINQNLSIIAKNNSK